MTLQTEYLGIPVELNSRETENIAFFDYCARGQLHLQCCSACNRFRYPPSPSCPWCAHPESVWKPVAGTGTVYSYMEVHHAVQPAFRPFAPFQILLVELDEQRGVPGPYDGLRMIGNLTAADGTLAPRESVDTVGIGSRVRMVFTRIADTLALPQWTLDDSAPQPAGVWRYPG